VNGDKHPVAFGTRLRDLAAERPDGVAVAFVDADGGERAVTYAGLDALAYRMASRLARRGVEPGDRVVAALPKSVEQLALGFAVWKRGATLVPLRHDMPVPERAPLVELAGAATIVDEDDLAALAASGGDASGGDATDAPVAVDRSAAPASPLLVASGGSTGRPKLIRTPLPSTITPGEPFNPVGAIIGMRAGQTVFTGSPPYHFMGFGNYLTVLEGGTSVVLERFDAGMLLAALERHRVNLLVLVPTMMLRLLRDPTIAARDLSSLEAIVHSAAPCPPWVKRAWIDLVGAERVFEIYSSTEQVGFCVVTGKEWLERPGTVGRGVMTEVRILDQHGHDVAAGEVGEIHMRLAGLPVPVYEYVGADRGPVTDDGFASVGDLGWLDDDGYLFIADRRTDLVISGGVNVYPAEVEAVLTEHPAVADAAVIGVPDDEWGRRVHAVVEVLPGAMVTPDELDAHCRARLSATKVPRSYELTADLGRNEAGKLRRSSLRG
jgi:bile acid-coenzyme A ligase